jgi:hypothetical protein
LNLLPYPDVPITEFSAVTISPTAVAAKVAWSVSGCAVIKKDGGNDASIDVALPFSWRIITSCAGSRTQVSTRVFKSAADAVLKAIRAARAVIALAIVAAIVLCVPDQTFEIYRVLIDPLQSSHLAPSALALIVATFTIWWTSKVAMKVARPASTSPAYRFAAGSLPLLIAAVIPIATFTGMIRAAGHVGTLAIPEKLLALNSTARALRDYATIASAASDRLILVGSVSLAIVGLATAIWLVLLVRRTFSSGYTLRGKRWSGNTLPAWTLLARTLQNIKRPSSRSLRRATIFAGLISAGCIAVLAWAPGRIQLAQTLGTLAVFYIFVSLSSILIVGLLSVRTPLRISAFSILLLLGVVFSSMSLNDNHRLSLSTLDPPKSPYHVQGEFGEWLKSRKDFAHFNKGGKPYPVFVVSAAGGGIYAASITALFLARMQDRCPGFAQHTFAISSVSGGSMGASLFSNLAKKNAANGEWQPCRVMTGPGAYETKVRTFLSNDFLAPILAAALFPDLVQQLLPVPVRPFDRARGLDGAMETAWDGIEGPHENPYRGFFLNHWSSDGAAPALVLNTFELESGNRMVISPFYLSYSASDGEEWTKSSWFYDQPVYEEGSRISKRDDDWWDDPPPIKADVKLSTAVGLSARFPWVLPAATFKYGDHDVRLVDGGYFENSGAETAYDIVKMLNDAKSAAPGKNDDSNLGKYEVYFIAITGEEFYESESSRALGEVLSPLRGLLTSRSARGGLAVWRALSKLTNDACEAGIEDCAGIPLQADRVVLNQRDLKLPLGFLQSSSAMSAVSAIAGDAAACQPVYETFLTQMKDVQQEAARRVLRSADTNNCVACAVQQQLHGLSHARSDMDCSGSPADQKQSVAASKRAGRNSVPSVRPSKAAPPHPQ